MVGDVETSKEFCTRGWTETPRMGTGCYLFKLTTQSDKEGCTQHRKTDDWTATKLWEVVLDTLLCVTLQLLCWMMVLASGFAVEAHQAGPISLHDCIGV